MKKYAIDIKRQTSAAILVTYDDDGVFQSVEIQTRGLKNEQINWILASIPTLESGLEYLGKYEFIRVNEVPDDLSFNAFWETYAYKVGKKERAIKLWMALDDTTRTRCLRSITRYNAWIAQRPTMERLYPETYLSQKRYDNEFKL